MYNLYQSQLRQDIQWKVYRKDHFMIKIFWKEYFGLKKSKKVGPFILKWYQVMWVTLPDDEKLVKQEIERIREEYSQDRTNMSFQLGLNNEIISFENISHRSKEFTEDMRQMRLNVREHMTNTFGLKLTVRENMPQCDIIYDISKSDEQLLAEMNSWAKERIKKWMNKWVIFERVDPENYEQFYSYRKEIAGEKWFNVMIYEDFKNLAKYIRENNKGDLFMTRIDDHVLAGSVCLFDDYHIIYYHGFANRDKKLRNIGGHAYLKFEIMRWARENGFTYVDMMWGAPTGFPDHPLAGVTKFKESLGGMKIEQYGSYDIVLNPLVYKIFERYTNLRH